MTTQVKTDVFRAIDAEHQDLNRQYEAFRAGLDDGPVRVPILRKRLAELAALLRCHFEHEEDDGYFTEIIDMAPRLSHQAEALEREHDQLLRRLQEIDDRISTIVDFADEFEPLRHDLCEFIEACCSHEHRENSLVQEAWLTEIGTGD